MFQVSLPTCPEPPRPQLFYVVWQKKKKLCPTYLSSRKPTPGIVTLNRNKLFQKYDVEVLIA